MIAVERGDEPPRLAEQRGRHLATLALAWVDGDVDLLDPVAVSRFVGPHSALLDSGYSGVREALRQRQHKKCVYCERSVGESEPLDHFRPRRPRWSGPKDDRTLEHPGYFWLTWTWENLLFSCTDCNLTKGSQFAVQGDRCCPWSAEVSVEKPEILDPSVANPSQHIEAAVDSRGKWTMQGKTSLGKTTARTLGLDIPSDRYDVHLSLLEHVVQDITEAASRGASELRRVWERTVGLVLAREEAPFRVLSHAFLANRLHRLIEEHDLVFPPACDRRAPGLPLPLIPARPELNELDEVAELHVRTLRRGSRLEDVKTVIMLLAEAGPQALTHLNTVLPQSSNVIAQLVDSLVVEGVLERDAQTICLANPAAQHT